ncbi:MAG: EamA family transporter [Candidatus Micrarchaeota archaeon]
MEKWLLFGILASLCWGTYVVLQKVSVSGKYFGIVNSVFLLLMLAGIAVVFLGDVIASGQKLELPASPLALLVAVGAGALWALGIVFATLALSGGADVAKLVPIYNTNTLVAVFLGIVLLGEVPSSANQIKVLIGAIMIIAGGILVSI